MTPHDPSPTSANIPLSARLGHEIPKPSDWQDFQRYCTLLFREELRDPNAQEYGRPGQKQRGIDILGRRNGDPNHYVGIQCRLIADPLKQDAILKECRRALELRAGLKEIIFATSAPDDTGASDAAIAVERILRDEGQVLAVAVYGWRALQTLIAAHPVAYNAFCPWSVATAAAQATATVTISAELVATLVAAKLRESGLVPAPSDGIAGAPEWAAEDPALHARIDTFRDLFKEHRQPRLAEQGLLDLLHREALETKPLARFRIETNLGAIACDLGREVEGAARFEAAHALRPDDAQALANLSLARLIQGRNDEAMQVARRALAATPRADHAVGYLLQAAARTNWEGDPSTLIPADLIGTVHADLGLGEFVRRRGGVNWARRCLEIGRRHQNVPELSRLSAIATLSLALESGAFVSAAQMLVTVEELSRAADEMKAFTEHRLDIGFADRHDLVADLNNTGLLLRLCGRHAECEALLRRGSDVVAQDPQLRRLLALAQAAIGHRNDALATLAGDHDVENQLLAAELSAPDMPQEAFERVMGIDPQPLEPRLAQMRFGLLGELALTLRDVENVRRAVEGLRSLDPNDISGALLEVRAARKGELDDEAALKRLREIARAVPQDASLQQRLLLADTLRNEGLPNEAALLLVGRVDLQHAGPVVTLYLQSLAAARQDKAFRDALASAAPEVRNDPEMLWTAAAHAWNVGDVESARTSIEALLAKEPEHPRARLFKIETLLRQNRSADVLNELDRPLEKLAWSRLNDRFRLASLLAHFGYVERAAGLAYRLFLENRDKPRAWMTLSSLVLFEGMGEPDEPRRWDASVVGNDIAVDLAYDDGEKRFLVVEPDSILRAFDAEALEPDHALVQAIKGLRQGARFEDPSSGQEGTIVQLRHKYVARLHYVMEHYEERFPDERGFQRVRVNPSEPEGFDEIVAQLKAKHDWTEQEVEQYRNGPWALAILAYRLGLDTIEVAAGLAVNNVALKVASGTFEERNAAIEAIDANAHQGCVLDVWSLWTAWRLQALDAIVATCGPIQLTQSVLDTLHERRERLDLSARDGLRTASYEAGRIAMREVPAEMVKGGRDDLDRLIAWVSDNATIVPLLAGDQLPHELQEHLRTAGTDVLHGVIAAVQTNLLLITDDMPLRQIVERFGHRGAWLHQIFSVAARDGRIDQDTFIRWSAHLASAGQNYLTVTATALGRAVELDAEAGAVPGYLFDMLTKSIGGAQADPASHVRVCAEFCRALWTDPTAAGYRARVTGYLLTRFLRGRANDYQAMLAGLISQLPDLRPLVAYVLLWANGHFTPILPERP
jgi:cellulose synthase operon protein C